MKYTYLEHAAKNAVDECVRKKAFLIMTVDGFISDTEACMLRDLLWYARDNNVDVHVVSKDSPKGGAI